MLSNMHLNRDRVELDYTIGEVEQPLVSSYVKMDYNSEEGKKTNSYNMVNLSLEPDRFSRDLLYRFTKSGSSREKQAMKREEEEEEDLELNLGLSLGGRFGEDKTKLVRSSSVASCLPITGDDDSLTPSASIYPTLVRTSSLPVETEADWRKRKEMQALRRMEAKRRRSEKQRNVRAEKEFGSGSASGYGSDDERRGSSSGGVVGRGSQTDMNGGQRLELLAGKRFAVSLPSPCRLNNLDGASRQASLGHGIDLEIAKGKASYVSGNGGQPFRQGSIGSGGGSSLSMSSQLESRPLPGSSSGSDLSPASTLSLQEGSSQDAGSSSMRIMGITSRSSRPYSESPSKGTDITRNRSKKKGSNDIQDMPCVFTIGDGPNGRRVDGILYKYGKGDEVKIMCVCHGSFLSPAEFVKHAGGINVTHPLKHIVIVPNPSSF